VEAGRYTSGSYPVMRCDPARGHRVGSERNYNSRSRWLSQVVGLPGLEPGTSSLSATHREPPCAPPSSQVAPDRRWRSYWVYRPAVTRSPMGVHAPPSTTRFACHRDTMSRAAETSQFSRSTCRCWLPHAVRPSTDQARHIASLGRRVPALRLAGVPRRWCSPRRLLTDRWCPWGTVGDRCYGHAVGTAARTLLAPAGQHRHRSGPEGEASPRDHGLVVGRRPATGLPIPRHRGRSWGA
jgi:hypothetical protein